jgi:hypothetical protein
MSSVSNSFSATVSGKPDATLAAAVELALAAAQQEAGPHGRVGSHLGASPALVSDGAKGVVHAFACDDPGYVGWFWAVELSRAPRSKTVTIDEVVLLPGSDAVLAPDWVPWSERLRPGDVGPGDILPTAVDDPRLTLRQADTEGWVDESLWFELGLGRPRVLSTEGREQAADRWYDGAPGPEVDIARSAPATCDSCGFYVRLVGALGHVFGACANEWASDDGKVVAVTHGCGAHSEAMVLPSARPARLQIDDDAVLPLDDASGALAAHAPGSVDDNAPDETSGHS